MKKNYLIRGVLFGFLLLNMPSVWAQTAQEFVHLGNVSGRQEKYKEAVRYYTKAIKADPNYANAYYNRGYVYIEMRKYKLAVTDLDRSIEIDPDYAPAYHLRGVAFYLKKMYGQAIANYNEAIQLEPQKYKILYQPHEPLF